MAEAEIIKIKVKNLETGKVDIFDVGAEDTMKDILDALQLDNNSYDVGDGLTGQFFDRNVKFSTTDKRSFVLVKK